MYSRSFYPPENTAGALPESYDGTRFFESDQQKEPVAMVEESAEVTAAEAPSEAKHASSLLSNLFGGGSIFGAGGFLSDIGIEEILIIAMAAFLFLSKDGDIECAVMLVLLLFIAK